MYNKYLSLLAFHFPNFDIQSLQFTVGGNPMPARRFEADYDTGILHCTALLIQTISIITFFSGDFLRCYESLVDVLALNSENSVPITMDQYKSMYNFYAIGKYKQLQTFS